MDTAHTLAAKLKKKMEGAHVVTEAVGSWAKKVKTAAASQAKKAGSRRVTYEDPSGRRFRVKRLLSDAGRFGEIYEAEEVGAQQSPGKAVAVKVMPFTSDTRRSIQREAKIHKILSGHPHIVKLESAFNLEHPKDHTKQAIFVLEFCNGGSLLDVINKRIRFPLGEAEVLLIFLQVCEAVGHMHSCDPPVAHRDIKIENVLLCVDESSGASTWKLCDFGSATTVVSVAATEADRQRIGTDIDRNTTMAYRPPEMIDLFRKQLICEKVDDWALGCLLFKMAFARDAFDEGPLQILNLKFTFPKDSRFSPQFHDLIRFILNPDPVARPHVGAIAARAAVIAGVKNPLESFRPYQHPASAAAQREPEPDELPNQQGVVPPAVAARSPSPVGSSEAGAPSATAAASLQRRDLFGMLDWSADSAAPAESQPAETDQAEECFECPPESPESTPPPLKPPAPPVPILLPPAPITEDFFAGFSDTGTPTPQTTPSAQPTLPTTPVLAPHPAAAPTPSTAATALRPPSRGAGDKPSAPRSLFSFSKPAAALVPAQAPAPVPAATTPTAPSAFFDDSDWTIAAEARAAEGGDEGKKPELPACGDPVEPASQTTQPAAPAPRIVVPATSTQPPQKQPAFVVTSSSTSMLEWSDPVEAPPVSATTSTKPAPKHHIPPTRPPPLNPAQRGALKPPTTAATAPTESNLLSFSKPVVTPTPKK